MGHDLNRMSSSGARTGGEERAFLTGPDTRLAELRRALGVFGELVRGFRGLHFAGPCVAVFGSSRFGEDHAYCRLARATGEALAGAGFTVMPGSGRGVMEAASRGAREAGGRTIGCAVELPEERPTNRFVDRELRFRHVFVRKLMLVKYSVGFVALPGGFGTMDEIFEALALARSGLVGDFPLVLMGEAYWRPLLELAGAHMPGETTAAPAELGHLFLTDSAEAATRHILRGAEHRFGVKLIPPRPSRLLGERALAPAAARIRRRRPWRATPGRPDP